MKQVIYAMQFKGNAAPKAGASGVIKASTTAPSCTLSSVVDPGGVSGTLLPVQGGKASFESEVTLTGETSFTETGTIRLEIRTTCSASAPSGKASSEKVRTRRCSMDR